VLGSFVEVTLHLGTLVALGIFLRQDLAGLVRAVLEFVARRGDPRDPYRKLALWIVLGTLPTGLVYVAGKKFLEAHSHDLWLVGYGFVLTGCLLLVTRLVRVAADRLRSIELVGAADALLIGLAQGFATSPGLSRCGSTVATGLLRGLDAESAVRFSFLLGFPAILGAELLEARHLVGPQAHEARAILPPLLVGTVVAAIVGFFSVRFLVLIARRGAVGSFAYYLFAMGFFTLYLAWRG
jgi:undecaprenyl-diphosphatase